MSYLYAGLCTFGLYLFICFLYWFCKKYPELYANFMSFFIMFAIVFCVFMSFYQLFN